MKGTIAGYDADGFIPRHQVSVYPDPPSKYAHIDEWPDAEAKNRAYEVFVSIDELNAGDLGCEVDEHHGIPFIRFAPEAQKLFAEWDTDLKNRIRSAEMPDVMKMQLAKYGSLMPSLALIFHVVEHCKATAIPAVSLHAAEAAAAWCDFLEAHARRIYAMCADGDISSAVTLGERIKAKESLPNPFTYREVAQKGWTGLGSVDEVEKAVGILEDRGWVAVVEVPSKDPLGRGRRSEKVWINPKVRPAGSNAQP
jgi:hypothetical protein